MTISCSAATHAERLPIEHGPRRTLWVIGFREGCEPPQGPFTITFGKGLHQLNNYGQEN